MNRIFLTITTCDENYDYFELAYKSLASNIFSGEVVLMVIDFGSEPSSRIEKLVKPPNSYVSRSNKGFCNNLNFGIAMSLWLGYDYYGHANDDVIVMSDFFKNAVDFLTNHEKAAFIGGVQQETNAVTIPALVLKRLKMPMPFDKVEKIDDLRGRWGDFSAWLAKTKAIRDIRYLDEEFDNTGIMADNDWLLRFRLAGWECWRNYKMRFLHGKGITQRKHRPGWPNDDVTKKARAYYISKWGSDAWSNDKESLFKTPFNRRREVSVYGDDEYCSGLRRI